MLLGRLRIRGKLTLLVMIPLLAMVGLVLPVVRNLVTNADKATDIDAAATVAGQVSSLLQDLQLERLLSVGYLLGAVPEDDLGLQTASVTDRVRDVQQNLGDELPPEVRAEIAGAEQLTALRERVRSKKVTPVEVLDAFAPVLDDMIESLGLVGHADANTAAGRQLIALDALLRMDESNTEGTAQLAIMSRGDVAQLAIRYREEGAEFGIYLDRFTSFATQPQRGLYDLVDAAFAQRLGRDFDVRFKADPVRTMAGLPIATLFPALQSFSVLGSFVEKRLVDDVTSLVAQQRRQQLAIAYGVGALALTVLLAVLILVAAVARAVAVPLTRLSRSAARVADAGEAELRRVADDDSERSEPVRLEELDVNSQDEIGDLARVFERVQSTASQLVERQVLSRRNVAEMFGHIGRRTQNLVGGQVSLIDELETEETNPERLAKLYRLDHISNRLRRSADSLVVISGANREESHLSPVRLVDVARLALAEIEEYTRVDIDIPLHLSVGPAIVGDLVLICAELLENATNFSPPHTRVSVGAQVVPGGIRLVIADHGIGMPDERLAEENARITRRERLDLVPTQVLGLFVVGRLARRHGLAFALSHTPGGGVTGTVHISDALLAGERVVASAAPLVPGDDDAPRAGTGRAVSGVAELEAMITARPAALEREPVAVDRSPSPWDDPKPATTVMTPYGSVPEPSPWGPGERRSKAVVAMSRVSELLRDPLTWNAFDVARRLPAVSPHHEVSATTAAVPDHLPAITDAVAAQGFVETFGSGPHPHSGDEVQVSSFNRRVPGATLSPGESAPRRAAGAAGQDPDEARSFAEQFESGVARALHDAS